MPGVRVVYIAGWTYGGTTLLGRLLGELDGLWFAGELRYYCRGRRSSGSTTSGCGSCRATAARWPSR